MRYVADLRQARVRVNAWWAVLVQATLAKIPDKVAAAAELRRRWPNGPATHPFIVAVVREYFLACERLNQEVRRERAAERAAPVQHVVANSAVPGDDEEAVKDESVPPGVFVGEYLIAEETRELSAIVAKFDYWPIGIDEQGSFT